MARGSCIAEKRVLLWRMYKKPKNTENYYKQDPEILRANGKYGHLGAKYGKLGGRPRKNAKPPGNPLEPPTPENLQEQVKVAIERLAMGYSVPVYQSNKLVIHKHYPPNIGAIQMVLDPNYDILWKGRLDHG